MRRLSNEYPRLSPNEICILGFMRMGLSNKEIANLLGILPKSFVRTKSRLRQKMGLEGPDALEKIVREDT